MTDGERTFRNFLRDAADKLFPTTGANILSPSSPPRWERLGWKVGWIVKEAHTGLQFWITEEHQWDNLTKDFGRNPRQKNQVFIDWYSDYLHELRNDLGVPLELANLRWRQMDLTQFEDRPLIEEEDWWEAELEQKRYGSWILIVPEKFVNFFEEEVNSTEDTDPPWGFLELWERVSREMKGDLVQKIVRDEGLRNHLASLVLDTSLDQEKVESFMPKHPHEEFQKALKQREENLSGMSRRRRKQTLDRWKQDALTFLLKSLGNWLENDEFNRKKWTVIKREWNQYRMEKLAEVYDTSSWERLWKNLEEPDLRQLIPRLQSNNLIKSIKYLSSDTQHRIKEHLPRGTDRNPEKKSSPGREKLLQARKKIYQQGKDVLNQLDYCLEGNWSLKQSD